MASLIKESLHELREYLESLLNSPEGRSPETRWREAVQHIANHIAAAFNVSKSEVAVLLKTVDEQALKFAYPPALAAGANVIPLKVWSFAGNVSKTATGALNNAFTEKRHLHFYENIKIEGRKSGPIHKIIAAPLTSGGAVFGVVEVSRKGSNAAEAGPDFGLPDLAILSEVLNCVAPYMENLRTLAMRARGQAV
jgi:hypothetical protein